LTPLKETVRAKTLDRPILIERRWLIIKFI